MPIHGLSIYRIRPMSWFPQRLYTAAEVRAAEARAQASERIDERGLMERAGGAAFACLRERWPRAQRVVLVAGTGNNGGDGYVLARHARNAGIGVEVLEVAADRPRSKCAADARTAFMAVGGQPSAFDPRGQQAALHEADVIVDGVFGFGLRESPGGEHATAIAQMNAALKPILALDVPSGLDADTGHAPGVAVHAAATVVFVGLKRGLFTGVGPDLAGDLALRTLDLPPEVLGSTGATTLSEFEVRTALQRRMHASHKGDYGAVLVVGGDHGYGGAAILAAEAALRSGAGSVRVATRKEHLTAALTRCPELMVSAVEDASALDALIERSSVIALGPGLAQGAWGKAMFARCMAADRPLIVDADALAMLAASPELCGKGARAAEAPATFNDCVLTPHPGEAAKLLGSDSAAVQRDRYAAATALHEKFGAVVVLKGAGTIVADGQSFGVCDLGNPGMATAGMGDVLTGIVAGLRAQGLDASSAARTGTWLHAAAGDQAAKAGERSLIASDLFAPLRALLDKA
jgi:NAD(P)H-hydrate epimerase